jgi:predicted nucleic acid-binding protein
VVIVSNTSPISNLAKVGQLDLMQKLYGKILIPTAVHEELLDERAGEIVISEVQSATWLEIHSAQNRYLVDELRTRVNIGEAEAIALAVEIGATRLLIDERLGRQAAKESGLKVTGVLGILLLAKRQNLISVVKPIVEELIGQANFRISSQLYLDILNEAGE